MGLVPCVSNSASAATAAMMMMMMMMVMVTVKTISTLYGANHHDGRTARSILPPPSSLLFPSLHLARILTRIAPRD